MKLIWLHNSSESQSRTLTSSHSQDRVPIPWQTHFGASGKNGCGLGPMLSAPRPPPHITRFPCNFFHLEKYTIAQVRARLRFATSPPKLVKSITGVLLGKLEANTNDQRQTYLALDRNHNSSTVRDTPDL